MAPGLRAEVELLRSNLAQLSGQLQLEARARVSCDSELRRALELLRKAASRDQASTAKV